MWQALRAMERGNLCTQTFNACHNSCCSTCILIYVITKKTDCRYYLFFRSFDKPLNAEYFSTLQHRLHTLYVTQRLVFALVTILSSWKAKHFFVFKELFPHWVGKGVKFLKQETKWPEKWLQQSRQDY